MPLFDYECPKCHTTQEHLISSQEPIILCPQCHDTMERIPLGRVATHVKTYTYGYTTSGERIKGQFGGTPPKKFRQRR